MYTYMYIYIYMYSPRTPRSRRWGSSPCAWRAACSTCPPGRRRGRPEEEKYQEMILIRKNMFEKRDLKERRYRIHKMINIKITTKNWRRGCPKRKIYKMRYIYIYIHMCMYIYIYIYIYTHTLQIRRTIT